MYEDKLPIKEAISKFGGLAAAAGEEKYTVKISKVEMTHNNWILAKRLKEKQALGEPIQISSKQSWEELDWFMVAPADQKKDEEKSPGYKISGSIVPPAPDKK